MAAAAWFAYVSPAFGFDCLASRWMHLARH